VIESIGILGATMPLLAFYPVTTDHQQPHSLAYLGLNALGSGAIVLYARLIGSLSGPSAGSRAPPRRCATS
jgi:hypothetical protein